jgi:hypothetical protein
VSCLHANCDDGVEQTKQDCRTLSAARWYPSAISAVWRPSRSSVSALPSSSPASVNTCTGDTHIDCPLSAWGQTFCPAVRTANCGCGCSVQAQLQLPCNHIFTRYLGGLWLRQPERLSFAWLPPHGSLAPERDRAPWAWQSPAASALMVKLAKKGNQ